MKEIGEGPEDALVLLRALSKSYPEGAGERTVFRDLDAFVRRGEFLVLLGRSGSGKSTLLNLIGGIDLPTRGEVVVGGRSLSRMTERDRTLFRRAHVGFVFQFFNLIPTLTVMENLLLPLELAGRLGKAHADRAFGLLDRVGLQDRADAYPDRLSGGEQQRVAVARALVHEPLLLLADEPTGNLDAGSGRTVLSLLVGMAKEGGRTVIVVTHSTETARLADRVLSIRDGRLAEEPVPR